MKFCVVGAGAWGTAFALHLARGARAVTLVPRRPEQAEAIARTRENREYLPGIALPSGVSVAERPGNCSVWKNRPELQAHWRFCIHDGCGLPVVTGRRS